jgi:hypothetical protein
LSKRALRGNVIRPVDELGRALTLINLDELPLRRETTYSRKPGFTDTRFRPFARLRESTLAPLFVFMRVRKPCFFERLRRLGWNVRLGMKRPCS